MLVCFFPSGVTMSQSWGEGLDETRPLQRFVTEYLIPAEMRKKSLPCLLPACTKDVTCFASLIAVRREKRWSDTCNIP